MNLTKAMSQHIRRDDERLSHNNALMFARMPNDDHVPWVEPRDVNAAGVLDQQAFDAWLQHQQQVLAMVYPTLSDMMSKKRQRQADEFNKRHKIVRTEFKIGDRVMTRDYYRHSKDEPRWVGPFVVQEVTPTGSYVLVDVNNINQLLRRNIADIKPYACADDLVPTAEPLALVADAHHREASVYAVDKIVDHRGAIGKRMYLVRWQGYDAAADTWEPEASMTDLGCVQEYWRQRVLDRRTGAASSSASSTAAAAPPSRPSRRSCRS